VTADGAPVDSAAVFFESLVGPVLAAPSWLKEPSFALSSDRRGAVECLTTSRRVEVVVKVPGFARSESQVDLDGKDAKVVVNLVRGARLGGCVTDFQGAPQKGVAVTAVLAPEDADEKDEAALVLSALNSKDKGRVDATTSAAGRFVLEDLAPGRRYLVAARSSDTSLFAAARVVWTLGPDVIVRTFPFANLALTRGASVTAHVRFPEGSVDVSPRISLERQDGKGVWSAFEGNWVRHENDFSCALFLPGTYRVFLDGSWGRKRLLWTMSPALTVAASANVSFDVALAVGRTITGQVVDENHVPVAGARVLCFGTLPDGSADTSRRVGARTGADGRYTLDAASHGTVLLRVSGSSSADVTVAAGETAADLVVRAPAK